MNNKLSPLDNLNKICRNNSYGLYKQWIYKNYDYNKMCDFMQKINYSIQDINGLLDNFEITNKNIVFLVVLVDWIKEAVSNIIELIDKKYLTNFLYHDEEKLGKYASFFKALRSFIVAHPLSTNKHKKFDLDGNYICYDIRKVDYMFNFDRLYIDLDGLRKFKNDLIDFDLYCYSNKKDGMRYTVLISCNLNNIIDVARIFIDKLYEIDKFLKKNIKRRNFI